MVGVHSQYAGKMCQPGIECVKLLSVPNSGQEFLPSEISGTRLYDPGKNSRENELREWLKVRWKDKYDY